MCARIERNAAGLRVKGKSDDVLEARKMKSFERDLHPSPLNNRKGASDDWS
jgi:hypothetical protein